LLATSEDSIELARRGLANVLKDIVSDFCQALPDYGHPPAEKWVQNVKRVAFNSRNEVCNVLWDILSDSCQALCGGSVLKPSRLWREQQLLER